MAAGGGLAHVGGVGRASLPGILARLVELTSEGVVVADGAGTVLYANDIACTLLAGGAPVAGAPLSALLAAEGRDGVVEPADGARAGALPLPADGSPVLARTAWPEGGTPVVARCDTVSAPGDTLLVVLRELDAEGPVRRDAALDDLRAANRRLSGILRIVLGTLDAPDVPELFSRVLGQLRETMEADGTALYLATSDGFRLRGATAALARGRAPRYLPAGSGIQADCVASGHALRLHLEPPAPGELRRGALASRTVVDEETGRRRRVPARMVPPLESMICVPVWFDAHAIALVVVGWASRRPTRRDDARLLDSVAKYLSTQLVGALSALRTRRAQELHARASSLHDRLAAAGSLDAALVGGTLAEACEELGAVPAVVEENTHQGVVVARLPGCGMHSLPLHVDELEAGRVDEGVAVVALDDGKHALELADYLEALGEPCRGAFVDLGELLGARRCFLALRPLEDEPFDDMELSFLRRVAEGIREVLAGELARTQDKRIAQALQTGMRSELQDVEGVEAEGIYSSATADASVGGDFYDLIRLPGRRACVIMGDVSGKGVEAASVSAAVRTALGAYAWQGLQPARMVRTLNRFLLGFSRLETFATLFVGVADLEAGTLAYCSAGHPPALLVRRGAQVVESLDVQSGVVGAFEEMRYRDGRVRLGEGDTLVLYTDGATEARDPSGAFFGEDGLREAVLAEMASGPRGLVDRLLARLDAFTGRHLEDDVAMVRLTFEGPFGAPARREGGAPGI